MERILIVSAHPDDETLGCGGSIARFTESGSEVRVLFLAEGVTSRYELAECSGPEVQSEIKKRNASALRALGILGVRRENIHLNYERYCCRLDETPLLDLVKEIEKQIQEFKPTRLLTHNGNDVNIDHRIVQQAVLTATRPVNIPFLKEILAFEVLSSSEWNTESPFAPNVFIDISDYIDRKLEALLAYGNEVRPTPHPRSPEVVRALATYRGSQAGFNYAEAFKLLRRIE